MRISTIVVATILVGAAVVSAQVNHKPQHLLKPSVSHHHCSLEGKCCCKDLLCWDKCFSKMPTHGPWKDAFANIYHLIQGIRNLYGPCSKPHGTAFLMDSSVPNFSPGAVATFALQRHLASIVAITQPDYEAGQSCNPFCVNKFFRHFAFYAHRWTCQNGCSLAATFNSISFKQMSVDSSSSWIGGGEILADHCFKNRRCASHSANELLVGFINSNVHPPTCPTGKYCVGVGVRSGPTFLPAMANWVSPGQLYEFKADTYHRCAAYRILSCMNGNCCPRHSHRQFPTRNVDNINEELDNIMAMEEKDASAALDALDTRSFGLEANLTARKAPQDIDVFEYNDEKSAGRYKTFKGSYEEFYAKIVKPNMVWKTVENDNKLENEEDHHFE